MDRIVVGHKETRWSHVTGQYESYTELKWTDVYGYDHKVSVEQAVAMLGRVR